MECPVCIEKITPSKKVECDFCQYIVCVKCTETYLTNTADDANCMNCKHMWNREILMSKLPKTWINGEYKRYREHVLLERETAMMPTTQPHVEQEKQRRKNVEVLHKLNAERVNLKRKLNDLNRIIFDVSRNLNPPLDTEKRSFFHRCGDPECRGFLSSAWKCNICDKYTCNECNVIKGFERDAHHVCDENDKLTMQAIKADSKKCPGCAQYIFKIDGCDQMWCTGCHTAFSWRTGQIINGSIHNPHFYEFQRNRNNLGRQLGDIPCGGLPSFRQMASALTHVNKLPLYDHIMKIHRIATHIELIEIPRYNHVVTETSNIDLRVRYMMNEISTDAFKSKIQQREKANMKKRDIGLILNMFTTLISDYFREIIHQKNIHDYNDDVNALIIYMNSSMITVSKRYDCMVPVIFDYRVTTTSHSKKNVQMLLDINRLMIVTQ